MCHTILGLNKRMGINYMDFLTEEEYIDIVEVLPADNQHLPDSDPNKFIAKMGAEAIHDLLARLDLDQISFELRHKANTETSQQRKQEALKRLQVFEAFVMHRTRIENRPEWMISESGTCYST
jgi:DNA-directed RNA polymerase subunit beta'